MSVDGTFSLNYIRSESNLPVAVSLASNIFLYDTPCFMWVKFYNSICRSQTTKLLICYTFHSLSHLLSNFDSFFLFCDVFKLYLRHFDYCFTSFLVVTAWNFSPFIDHC